MQSCRFKKQSLIAHSARKGNPSQSGKFLQSSYLWFCGYVSLFLIEMIPEIFHKKKSGGSVIDIKAKHFKITFCSLLNFCFRIQKAILDKRMQQRIPIYVEPRYLARYYHRDVCLKWRLSCSLWAHSAHLLISGQCSISIPPENVRKPEIDFDQAFVSLVREVFRTLSNIYNQGVIQEFILGVGWPFSMAKW